jgi:hypothetical protein
VKRPLMNPKTNKAKRVVPMETNSAVVVLRVNM